MNRRHFSALMATVAGAALTGLPLHGAFAQTTPAAETAAPVVAEMVLGNLDAKVTLIEYASFTCPHCANFHEAAFNPLKRDYIDTGKVKFIYRDVFFDRYGLWASMVARCGDGLRFFGISDILYSTQKDWLAGGDPAVIAERLRKIGLVAGLDAAKLDACLNDGEMAQALVATYQTNAEKDGVNSTPTLFLNGTKYNNMSFADLSKLIDAELAK